MYIIVHVSQQGMTGDVYVSFEGNISLMHVSQLKIMVYTVFHLKETLLFNACFSAINNGIYSVSFEGNISLMHVSQL